jgi:hypothetical protein
MLHCLAAFFYATKTHYFSLIITLIFAEIACGNFNLSEILICYCRLPPTDTYKYIFSATFSVERIYRYNI